MPRVYSEDGTSFSIECSAPVFFFGIKNPSGIVYNEDIADEAVKLVEQDDISVMAQIGTLKRKIGVCYNLVKQKDEAQGTGLLLARLALSPGYQWLEDDWNMQRTQFSLALQAQVPEDKQVSMENVEKIASIFAHLNTQPYK